MSVLIEHGKTWEGFPYVSIVVEGYAFPGDLDMYLIGIDEPHYPMPAIPFVFQWDYSLGLMLDTYSMSDEEWDREEQEWQDHLDKLDGLI